MVMVSLCKRLQGMKLEEDEDARAHVIRLLDLQEQLAFTGNNFDDDEFVLILSGSLPHPMNPPDVINRGPGHTDVLGRLVSHS